MKRVMDFTMARPNLVKVGDKVKVTEGKLLGSFYYTIEPAVAMSANFRKTERLHTDQGVVVDVGEGSRGYYVKAEFDEPDEA